MGGTESGLPTNATNLLTPPTIGIGTMHETIRRPAKALITALLLVPLAAIHAADNARNRIDTASDANRYVTADGAPHYDRWVRDYFDERFRLNGAAAFRRPAISSPAWSSLHSCGCGR